MKARDIIPGWPKSRSMSAFTPHRGLAFWFRLVRADDPRELADLMANIEYHEAQQRMMNAHFEKWRTPEEPIPWRDRDILLRGVLGSCVSFSIPD